MNIKLSAFIMIMGALLIMTSANSVYSQSKHKSKNHTITTPGFPIGGTGTREYDGHKDKDKENYNNERRDNDRTWHDNGRHRGRDKDRTDTNYHEKKKYNNKHHGKKRCD